MTKRLLALVALLFSVTFLSTAQVVYSDSYRRAAEPNGSKYSPYLIKTAQDLRDFAQMILDDDKGTEGKFWRLEANINLQCSKDFQWIPIGNVRHQFSGNFDGNGYTISGLFRTSGNYVGLFAYLSAKGQIYNLTIDGILAGKEYVGGIVAVNYGTITNCHNRAMVGGQLRVGGIAGYSCGTIANCLNTGPVTGKKSTAGICGTNYDGYIYSSCNLGIIDAGQNAGGIAGSNGGRNVQKNFTLSSSISKAKGGENSEIVTLEAIKAPSFLSTINGARNVYNNTYSGNQDTSIDISACPWRTAMDGSPTLSFEKQAN